MNISIIELKVKVKMVKGTKLYPAGTTRWNNVEMYFLTSRPNFNYISTLFQRQMPAGYVAFQNISINIWYTSYFAFDITFSSFMDQKCELN